MDITDRLMEIVYQHSFQVKPGFFLEKFGDRQLRNVFVSESAVAEIENVIYKTGHAKALYSSSKDFGYTYASRIPLPKMKSIIDKAFFKRMINFFETTYGRTRGYDIDLNNHKVITHYDNFIVCRKNGRGIFAQGAFAGIMAYLLDDPTIECVKLKCEGRGDPDCMVIIAPIEQIKEYNPYDCPTIQSAPFNTKYSYFNTPIQYKTDYGLELLTKAGIVNYSSSMFDFLGERFFPIEISFIPCLEQKLASENIDLKKTIYTPTFEFFKSFSEDKISKRFPNNQNHIELMCKLYSAFGWGILEYLGNKILVKGFPWTDLAINAPVPEYFLGTVDGLLSGLSGKTVTSTVLEATTNTGNFTVAIEVS